MITVKLYKRDVKTIIPYFSSVSSFSHVKCNLSLFEHTERIDLFRQIINNDILQTRNNDIDYGTLVRNLELRAYYNP